jgi:hypothetical protein
MSLLQLDSPELDDAARGEDLTKGSSHVLWTSGIAAVLVILAVVIYVIAGQKPPVATGEIEQVWVHPQHTEGKSVDANGAAMAKESFDQVLVFSQVKLHNQSEHALVLHNVMANATLPDGIHSSYAAIPADYERLFAAYPELASIHGKPLALDSTIQPGETVEGNLVSAFRLTKQEWGARKDLSFTFGLLYQPSLVLTPHPEVVIDR